MLIPRLEKLAHQCNGAFVLAKLNVDDSDNAALMKQLPIQSIPTVFGVKQGNIISQFTGNIDDTQLTNFFDQLFGRPLKQVIDDANVVDSESTDQHNAAELQYRNALFLVELNQNRKASDIFTNIINNANSDSDSEKLLVKATVGLAQCILNEANSTSNIDTKQQLIQSAVQLIEDLKSNSLNNKSIAKQLNDTLYSEMQAKLSMINEVSKLGGKSLVDLQADVDNDPRNSDKLYALGLYLYSTGQIDDSIVYCLNSIRYNKQSPARKLILKIMDTLGKSHPTTIITRRKLTNILY